VSEIVGLEDALDRAIYGGKAAHLARARRAGFPVADGFAVAAALAARVADDDADMITVVGDAYDRLGGAVAVRSSAIGEDGESASYAGQHLTILNVRGREPVVRAMREVARSVLGAGAAGYRRRLAGTPPSDGGTRIAVVVQRLVAADVAGVLFSRDPLTGADDVVIEASWGLGEAVVAGRVIPDRYRMSRAGAILAREAGHKPVAIRPRTEGGTVEIPLAEGQARSLCLDDERLAALHDLGRRCEAAFGAPQDVEWAFAGGHLSLLQSRPITRRPLR
jgi:pyruvate,water dikinase